MVTIQSILARLRRRSPREPDDPIPMILFCPACGCQHIDVPDGEWINPPHRSHLCETCGHIWRPADAPTSGVLEIASRGKNDDNPVRGLAQWRQRKRSRVTKVGG